MPEAAETVVVVFDYDKTILDCDSDDWVTDHFGLSETLGQLLRAGTPWNSLMVTCQPTLSLSLAPISRLNSTTDFQSHACYCFTLDQCDISQFLSFYFFWFSGSDDDGNTRAWEINRRHRRLLKKSSVTSPHCLRHKICPFCRVLDIHSDFQIKLYIKKGISIVKYSSSS